MAWNTCGVHRTCIRRAFPSICRHTNITCFSTGESCGRAVEYPWDRLHDSLHGAGVPNLDEALDQLRLQPLHDAFRAALEPAILAKIIDAAEMDATERLPYDSARRAFWKR